jgi:peroxiredoxin
VLGLFAPASGDCVKQIDTIQKVSAQFSTARVQFAAVAIRTSHKSAAALVRTHHWTIPVAYDRDGAIGDLYGVQVCPMVELAYRGGVVKDRLVSDKWLAPTALAGRVQALINARGG